jgi:predicted TIM-barrel fold metal-dependent hydrolase
MVDRQRVFDADTHFQPAVESIVQFLDKAMVARLPELEEFKTPVKTGRAGQPINPPYRHWYRFARGGGWGAGKPRHLGEAGPRPSEERHFQTFMGDRYPTLGVEDHLLDTRVAEMDEEGVDAQILVPSAFTGHTDSAVDVAFIQALNRFMDHSCSQHPERLYSMIFTTARDIAASVAEVKAWGGKKWAKGIYLDLPVDYPIDHPDLHPLWAAVDEHGLTMCHHSFATGYPGYRDLWENPFLGRTAGHPWGAMRSVAAFFGSGLFDKYPNMKYAVMESGFGWLPFWAKRMEDQVVYMGYVAENLQRSMTQYMTDGRFFCSVVLHEGPDMVRMVSEILGDHILMFGSDYPHAESRFPISVKTVDDWPLTDIVRRKLMWDNAARCFDL